MNERQRADWRIAQQVIAEITAEAEAMNHISIEEFTAEYAPTAQECEVDKVRHSLATDDEWDEAA